MKIKLQSVILLILTCFGANAQPQLWSMTPYHDSTRVGAIFNIGLNGSGYSTPFVFNGAKGAYPKAGIMMSSNGKLYGVTQQGGSHGSGVLFSYNRSTGAYDTLHNFTASITQGSTCNLVEANGKLYGMITTGGTSNYGVLFSYDTLSGVYDTLHNFICTTGCLPMGSLMQANDGNFYGMTYSGGDNFDGVIFRFDPVTNAYDKIFDFDALNGQGPYGSLMQASNGKLYGMTKTGSGYGNIFSYDLSDSTLSNLFVLSTANGSNPFGELTEVSGVLYGLTSEGGANNKGVIFSIDTSGSNYTILQSFDGVVNGESPKGSLFKASNGILYGMTSGGGANGAGVIFSYTTQLNNLRSLNMITDGNFPQYANFIEINNSTAGVPDLIPVEAQLSVYPNPAHDAFSVTVENILDVNATVYLWDALGRKVAERFWENTNNSLHFSTRDLSPGIYTMQMMISQKMIFKKVVIE